MEQKAKFRSRFKLNEETIRRVKKLLAGAAKTVHQHRSSVGIHEGEAHAAALDYNGTPTNQDIVTVAMANEFGHAGLPERSWLRSWYDQNLDRLKRESSKAMKAEYKGDATAVANLDRKWRDELKEWIETGFAALESLAPATIEAREKAGLAGDPPLYATGQLVKAIRGMLDAEYVG